jgi:predicted kinase
MNEAVCANTFPLASLSPVPQFLLILQGLPGSGKSTIARALATAFQAVICSTDDFFTGSDGVYRFDARKHAEYHAANQARAAELLRQGRTVIVDNCNTRNWEAARYVAVAYELKLHVQFVRVSGNFNSAHKVPEAVIETMRLTQENLSVEACLAYLRST